MPQIQTLVKRLRHADIAVQLEACDQLCDQLAQDENPPIGAVIAAGAVPLLLQLFERVDAPVLQYAAAAIIVNLVSDDAVQHTQKVVDHGAIAALVRLLVASRQLDNSDGLTQAAADCITKAWEDHPIPDKERPPPGRPLSRTAGVHMLRHHALFALGNFAGDAYFRHCVLDAGALPVVLAELERSSLAGGWKSENQDYRVDDYVRVCGTVEAGTLSAGSSLPSGAKAIVCDSVQGLSHQLPRASTGGRLYDVRVPETGQTACVWANDMVHESEVTKHRCAGWLLLNLCRGRDRGEEGKPKAPLEQFDSALPVIARILRDATDVQLIESATAALEELTANVPDEQLRAVLDTGVAPRLLEILGVERLCVDAEVAGVRVQSRHRKACIDTTLQVVGNIVTGSEEQTQQLLDLGLLPRLHRILATSSDERLRRTNRTNHPRRINACWAVSNICAGTEEQRHAVWEAELFP